MQELASKSQQASLTSLKNWPREAARLTERLEKLENIASLKDPSSREELFVRRHPAE